jgi:polyhydroxybutyrate depolymerase
VVALHGSGLTADNINTVGWSLTGGWASHAETHGYTLALGEGAERSWNPGGAWTLHHGQDDIAYLAEMATDVASRTPIEPARRFIAGFSAGAAMAWTATVRRPDLFAACASSSGWAAEYPPIGQPIDCWHCHGTADVTIPIRGGAGALGIDYPAASLEATRAPRGSRVVMYAASWGHAMPGWFAGAAWDFFTRDRLLP